MSRTKVSEKHLLLCSFPLYTVGTLGDGNFYVAGGGGQAKTGVPNAIEVHSLFHNGCSYSSKRILQRDMGSDLVMNSDSRISDGVIAVGIGNSSQLLKLHKDIDTAKTFTTKKTASFQTDFGEGDSYQKVVSFGGNGSFLVTGGCDGIIRIWKYPSLSKKAELRGHKSEIEDISIHSDDNTVVSVCRGGEGRVWNVEKSNQLAQFSWQPKEYRLKNCRFSPKSDDQGKIWLYSISVPIKWAQQAKKQCYLIKWCTSSWKLSKLQTTYKELACALAINSDGSRIAIGTTEGTVSIYNADFKLLIKAPSTHSVFITGLTFMIPGHSPEFKRAIMKKGDEVLLSISADRTCHVTRLERKGDWNVLLFGILPFLFIFASILFLVMIVV